MNRLVWGGEEGGWQEDDNAHKISRNNGNCKYTKKNYNCTNDDCHNDDDENNYVIIMRIECDRHAINLSTLDDDCYEEQTKL